MAGTMSRQQMQELIEGGQSVSYGGRIIRDVRDLPAEEEIAVTAAEKRTAIQSLKQQHADLGERIKLAEADADETEKREAEHRPSSTPKPNVAPVTHTMGGQPANPVTTQQPPVTRTDGNVGPVKTDEGTGEGEDRVVANRKLSTYRKAVEKAGVVNRDEVVKFLEEKYEGVGKVTAEEIADALSAK
jgi:hypothetical protein